MDSLKGQQFMKKNESVVSADTAFQEHFKAQNE